jgi:hypothetical protein
LVLGADHVVMWIANCSGRVDGKGRGLDRQVGRDRDSDSVQRQQGSKADQEWAGVGNNER